MLSWLCLWKKANQHVTPSQNFLEGEFLKTVNKKLIGSAPKVRVEQHSSPDLPHLLRPHGGELRRAGRLDGDRGAGRGAHLCQDQQQEVRRERGQALVVPVGEEGGAGQGLWSCHEWVGHDLGRLKRVVQSHDQLHVDNLVWSGAGLHQGGREQAEGAHLQAQGAESPGAGHGDGAGVSARLDAEGGGGGEEQQVRQD